jgi:hypothetical protein
MDNSLDSKYIQILLDRIAVCKSYKPKFGQGENTSLKAFQALYGADSFYSWFGLDTPLMYSAHKVAGGITSVYRQIGLGSEELFRQILQDHLGLTSTQVNWSYEINSDTSKMRTLKLDGRIEPIHIANSQRQQIIYQWMKKSSEYLQLDSRVAEAMRGIVMEVRQGYKSKDSKRQNADIANATEAYINGYLPILIVFSSQIDNDIVERYERGKWLVLRGTLFGDNTQSTYTFMREIIGYDLAGFFERNNHQLKTFTQNVLEYLLRADDD